MPFVPGLGLVLSERADKLRNKGQTERGVVCQLCLEAGVAPPKDGSVGLAEYTELHAVVRERVMSLIEDGSTVETTCETIVSASIEKDELEQNLESVALLTGKAYKGLSDMAEYMHGGIDSDTVDPGLFWWLYASGPLAKNEFPKRWWFSDTPAPSPAYQTVRYGALADASGVAVQYTVHGAGRARNAVVRFKRPIADDPSAYDRYERLLEAHAQHLLSSSERDDLLQAIRKDINLRHPDFGTLSAYGVKDVDLQRVDPTLLDEFKQKMQLQFESSAVKEDDPSFQYDMRQNFEPVETNEWDSD
ncbi:hypothetical protein DIPPA_02985 [Diplonema papillatum]|nr:hypothetical protein DIPPA_02985 [Diplonema papillatum]|eukprot:gene4498-6968_t